MSPKLRFLVFMGIVFALMLPYAAFFVYFFLRLPKDNLPNWFTNTIAIWYIANFLILFVVSRRLFRKQLADWQPVAHDPSKAQFILWILRGINGYLLIIALGSFLYAVKAAINGTYLLSRNISVAVLSLVFGTVFAWGLYRSWPRKSSSGQ